MQPRRAVLMGTGIGVATGLAGCLGVLTGEEPAEFEAAASSVAQSALDESGYEPAGVEEVVIEREFEAAGQTRDVVVTNYQATYEKAIDMGPLGRQQGAVFTSLTTPQVRVLDREFNPVADMSTAELAEMVQEQYEEVRDIDHQEDSDVTINGQPTTQSRFLAEATLAGEAVDLNLHVSEAVDLADDLVVTVGAYPELTPEEAENVGQLMAAVQPAG